MRVEKALGTLVALVVVVAGIKVAASLSIPIHIAFFIGTVSFSVLNFLRKKGFPRLVAVKSPLMRNLLLLPSP
jgi:predicted PurR-regulated permease PerM